MHIDNPLNLQVGDRLVDNDRRWDQQRIIQVEAVFRLGSKWYFRYTTERGRRSRVAFDHVYEPKGNLLFAAGRMVGDGWKLPTQGYTIIK